jgi:hypothetical protein
LRLAFDGRLIVVDKFDVESVILADQHYSRQKPGSNQFMPPGRTLVIRDAEGTLVFGWLSQQFRDDGESGYNCSIFRNVSGRLSSDAILECERIAFGLWGESRLFTYVDPVKVRSANPGYCFKMAGWKFARKTLDGKHLLAKELS